MFGSERVNIKIEESVQFCQRKLVIFDVVDAPKGNMAVQVRDYKINCPDKELGQKIDLVGDDLEEGEDSPKQ